MTRLLTVLVLIAGIGARSVASAQTSPTPPHASTGISPSVAGWTAGGAGAGFGLGFYLGFRAFDQATYAERKIMTAAVVGAAAGAVGGYLVGRLDMGVASRVHLPRHSVAKTRERGCRCRDPSHLRGGLKRGPDTTEASTAM